MVIFLVCLLCFALSLLKLVELFSKKRFWAEIGGPGPGVWMGMLPSSFTACQAESLKLR